MNILRKDYWTTMETHLPYKSVVLFIACGAMVFAIVFVFAKRQITRFALKSNRVPHATIGANVPKTLRQEIEQHLKRVEQIKYEPQLLSETISSSPEFENYQFFLRMKALDGLKLFDTEQQSLYPDVKRQHGESLRRFLLDQQLHDSGCLHGIRLEIINRFAQVYEHARHDPTPFQQDQCTEFMDLLNNIIDYMKRKHSGYSRDGVIMEPSCVSLVSPDEENYSLLSTASAKSDSRSKHGVGASIIPGVGASIIPSLATTKDHTEVIKDHSPSTESESHVVYRPRRMKDSDSGMFLLTSRHSGCSQDSTVETETQFRPAGLKDGRGSFV